MNELKKIKKKYGEEFMHLCKKLFPTVLEQEGRLYEILSSLFSGNCKTLYEDIEGVGLKNIFKGYIFKIAGIEDPEENIKGEKTPYELLEEAGYNLTESLTEEEIQEFRKYYKPGEELCTFDGGRLDSCVVFWAVKKNAEDIKREDFIKPRREDEYATSVMGIQFERQGMCTVSIKNRYNHVVKNPDATYGNDLERIIPGLTRSFGELLKREYGLELNKANTGKFELSPDDYVIANDGKYYKYNVKVMGKYYCPENIVIDEDGNVIKVGDPEKGLLIDYFYIDKEKKKIEICGENIKDSFLDEIQGRIEKIKVVKSKDENVNRVIEIYLQDVEEPVLIGIDKNNQIVKYTNKTVTNIGSNFLRFNNALTQLELPNVTQIGHNFLFNNITLNHLELPNVTQIGGMFLFYNITLNHLELPNVTQIDGHFLDANEALTQLELPNLTQVGRYFLSNNEVLTRLVVPNLPELEKRFSEIIDKNVSQKDRKTITKRSIVQLVKDSKLTTTEVDLARKKIEEIKDLSQDNTKERQGGQIEI